MSLDAGFLSSSRARLRPLATHFSLRFGGFRNSFGSDQVQRFQTITVTGPRGQSMLEDFFRYTTRVANCYLIDQWDVSGAVVLFAPFGRWAAHGHGLRIRAIEAS